MARILIVDDDFVTLRLAACVLGAHGHDVRVATSAEAAWEQLGRETPEIALIDRGLPGMDGLALTRRIKRTPALARVIVLAFSAHGALEDDARAREAGSDGFVPKPTDMHHLLRCVTWHLAALPLPQSRSTMTARPAHADA